MTSENRPAIDLRIEELVLEGFERRDAGRIAESLRTELMALLQSGEFQLPANGIDLQNIDAGTLDLNGARDAGETGRALARSVYQGLRDAMGRSA